MWQGHHGRKKNQMGKSEEEMGDLWCPMSMHKGIVRMKCIGTECTAFVKVDSESRLDYDRKYVDIPLYRCGMVK